MRRYFLSTICLAVPFAAWAGEAAPREPLRLSLKRAVEIATSPEGNTYIQLSDENLKQAKSRSAEARSAFLPDIEAQAEQITAMKSFAALGLDLATDQALLGAEKGLSPTLAGIAEPLLNDIIKNIPRVVGPFNSVDVRARLTQSVFDFSSIRRYQASRAAIRAAAGDRGNTDDSVSATVAKAYLAALRADADVEAYQANVALAEAVLKQSENQKSAGTGTGIEVTRAKVQLSNEKQHLLVVQNERSKAYLQLLRAMGLSLATELELTDKLSYEPTDAISVEQAQAEALKTRPDIKAQAEHEAAARLNANSVKLERLPSLVRFCGLRHHRDQRRRRLSVAHPGLWLRAARAHFRRRPAGRPARRSRLPVPPGARAHQRSPRADGTRHPHRARQPAFRRRAVQSRRGRVDPFRQRAHPGPPPLRGRLRQQSGSHRRPDPAGTGPG